MQLKLIRVQHIPSSFVTQQQHDAQIENFINESIVGKQTQTNRCVYEITSMQRPLAEGLHLYLVLLSVAFGCVCPRLLIHVVYTHSGLLAAEQDITFSRSRLCIRLCE
jgi:hypothetical protein